MITSELIQIALGFGLSLLAQRLGLKVPGVSPAADKPFTDCLAHLLEVKAGNVKLDDKDKEVLKSIKPLLEDLIK